MILFSTTQDVARAAALPGTRLIQTVGKDSYEIYLTHMLVVLGLMPFIVKLKPDASIPMWYIAFLLLSVVLGLTVQRFYSEPMNKFLRTRSAAHVLPDNTAA